MISLGQSKFDGSIVLKKLSEIKRLDEFYAAVDANNFGKARTIMEEAGIDSDSITTVLSKMKDAGN